MTGNRCGHDRHHIRRSLRRSGSGQRQPLVLTETARLFARAIVERPQDFPELAATRDTDKKRRTERLEAIGLVVLALAVRADVLTTVVRWKGEGLDTETIAKWTRLDPRRVGRALFDLRWGYLVSGPGKFGPNRIPQPVEAFDPRETKAGRCTRKKCIACARGLRHLRGKAAIRKLTILLFEKVGTDGWLAEEQRKRYAALEKPPRRPLSQTALRLQAASVRREARLLAGPSERPPPD